MLTTKKILISALPLSEKDKSYFSTQVNGGIYNCEFIYIDETLTPDKLKDVNVLIGKPEPALLKNAKKIEWLQLVSAGYDSYINNLPQNVILTCASGAYGLAVSEHMLAQTFTLIRHFNQYCLQAARGEWKSCGNIISVEGSTILVLGMGDIGGSYARKMKALGAHVIGVRRHLGKLPEGFDEQHTMSELDNLLPIADVVAMALPGGHATYHIIDEHELGLMKDGAYIINAGRGNAIAPDALKKVLREHKIGGAALDVTEPEPLPPDDELMHLDNVLITPHVAGNYYLHKTVERIINIVGHNLNAWAHGGNLKSLL